MLQSKIDKSCLSVSGDDNNPIKCGGVRWIFDHRGDECVRSIPCEVIFTTPIQELQTVI